jgi:hypothetical protein
MRGDGHSGGEASLPASVAGLAQALAPEDMDPSRGDRGAARVLAAFTAAFWEHLGAGGYEPPDELVAAVSGPLSAWVASGLVVSAVGGVVPLAAAFEPSAPLGLYLFGVAGAGKSSFVRHLVDALALAVNQLLDPQMEVGREGEGVELESDTPGV